MQSFYLGSWAEGRKSSLHLRLDPDTTWEQVSPFSSSPPLLMPELKMRPSIFTVPLQKNRRKEEEKFWINWLLKQDRKSRTANVLKLDKNKISSTEHQSGLKSQVSWQKNKVYLCVLITKEGIEVAFLNLSGHQFPHLWNEMSFKPMLCKSYCVQKSSRNISGDSAGSGILHVWQIPIHCKPGLHLSHQEIETILRSSVMVISYLAWIIV